MIEKRFTVHEQMSTILEYECAFDDSKKEWLSIKDVIMLLNKLHEENMNNGAEITRFKIIVSDIVNDLEKQAKNEEPIVISMAYVDWIKSELDLKLNGLKGDMK